MSEHSPSRRWVHPRPSSNGAAMPIVKNLNEESTHPRPWRPPTDWNHFMRIYDPYPVLTPTGPQFFKRTHNWIEDDPFMTNLYYSAKKGFGFGKTCHAVWLLT